MRCLGCCVVVEKLLWNRSIGQQSSCTLGSSLAFSWYLYYGDAIMGAITSQITSLTIVCSTADSDADQRKHQSSASLVFVRVHRGPVNSPHKWPVTRKMFPFDDGIMRSPWLLLNPWVRFNTYKTSYQCGNSHHKDCLIFTMLRPLYWNEALALCIVRLITNSTTLDALQSPWTGT